MWRVVYFVLSCIVLAVDYFILKHFNYQTLTVFIISAVLVFLFEFLFIRKKTSKIILGFFIAFFLTLITVLLTISTINTVGITLSLNEKLIILFVEGYLIFGIIIAFIPSISNMFKLTKQDKTKTAKILDTSVIVDGRIYRTSYTS